MSEKRTTNKMSFGGKTKKSKTVTLLVSVKITITDTGCSIKKTLRFSLPNV